MQLGSVLDVEDADVAVLPGDAPEMAPLPGALQVLRGALQGITVIGSGWRTPNTCRSRASRR